MGPEWGRSVFTLLTSWVFSPQMCQVHCNPTGIHPVCRKALGPLQGETMEEDTQWYCVSVSPGICLPAWLSFLWYHTQRLLSSPNITVPPAINKPAPLQASTVTSLHHEGSVPLSFHHPIQTVSTPGVELGSLCKGSTRGIFRTGMGIATNFSVLQLRWKSGGVTQE